MAVGSEHIAAITEDGRLFTMGTTEGNKLGHAEKVKTEEEVEEERLRYKRAGYKPGSLDKSKPQSGFVEGLPEG